MDLPYHQLMWTRHFKPLSRHRTQHREEETTGVWWLSPSYLQPKLISGRANTTFQLDQGLMQCTDCSAVCTPHLPQRVRRSRQARSGRSTRRKEMRRHVAQISKRGGGVEERRIWHFMGVVCGMRYTGTASFGEEGDASSRIC